MADIHIHRDHPLGMSQARQVAIEWAEQAESSFGMACTYSQAHEGGADDLVTFSRPGVKGTLKVSGQRFELEAQLGFLYGAFKDKIEAEISKNLDQLLAGGHQA